MSKRLPQSNFFQGGFYHIYNRGNRRQNIFMGNPDYKRYLEKLREYAKKHNVSILAYCLMPNHVHLLVRQNGPDPVSSFIQRLHTAYSMYFNKKYHETGHLFEDRFKAKMVNRDEYIIHLSRYIHLNPGKLVKRLPAYKWSSYPAYFTGKNDELLDTKFILSYFKRKNDSPQDTINSYVEFVRSQEENGKLLDHLTFKEEKAEHP